MRADDTTYGDLGDTSVPAPAKKNVGSGWGSGAGAGEGKLNKKAKLRAAAGIDNPVPAPAKRDEPMGRAVTSEGGGAGEVRPKARTKTRPGAANGGGATEGKATGEKKEKKPFVLRYKFGNPRDAAYKVCLSRGDSSFSHQSLCHTPGESTAILREPD